MNLTPHCYIILYICNQFYKIFLVTFFTLVIVFLIRRFWVDNFFILFIYLVEISTGKMARVATDTNPARCSNLIRKLAGKNNFCKEITE